MNPIRALVKGLIRLVFWITAIPFLVLFFFFCVAGFAIVNVVEWAFADESMTPEQRVRAEWKGGSW